MPLVVKEKYGLKGREIADLAVEWNLHAVYDHMVRELGSNTGLLGEVCNYLLSVPGKGVRPLFVLISSSFSQLDKNAAVRLATALETLHLATLAHDDVLDGSKTRRGAPSVNSRWDDNTAILTGDFLFGKSLEMVQGFGEEVVGRFAGIIVETVTGEFLQAEMVYDPSLSIETYKEIIGKKTATLFANCCAMAAVASGTPRDVVACLEDLGFYSGMAFQIKNDIADWGQDEKGPGSHDLQQGILTLPLLLALQLSKNREKMVEVVSSKKVSETDMSFIREEVVKTGALELSCNAASFYGQQAKKRLNFLPKTNGRNSLEKLIDNICAKTFPKKH